MYDIDKMKGEIISTDKRSGLKTDESSFIFYLNYRLFITSHLSEIYYLDLPRISGKFSFRGSGAIILTRSADLTIIYS